MALPILPGKGRPLPPPQRSLSDATEIDVRLDLQPSREDNCRARIVSPQESTAEHGPSPTQLTGGRHDVLPHLLPTLCQHDGAGAIASG